MSYGIAYAILTSIARLDCLWPLWPMVVSRSRIGYTPFQIDKQGSYWREMGSPHIRLLHPLRDDLTAYIRAEQSGAGYGRFRKYGIVHQLLVGALPPPPVCISARPSL